MDGFNYNNVKPFVSTATDVESAQQEVSDYIKNFQGNIEENCKVIFNQLNKQKTTSTDVTNILATAYPVGALYLSTVSTNPSGLLGFGTWVAWAQGQTLVGLSDAGTFATPGASVGAETVTLDSTMIPSHNHTQDTHGHTQVSHNHTQDAHSHTQNAHTHTQNSHSHTIPTAGGAGAVSVFSYANYANTNAVNTGDSTATNQNATATNQNTTATNQATTATNNTTVATNQATGGGLAHSNIQPSLVVYIFKRTA